MPHSTRRLIKRPSHITLVECADPGCDIHNLPVRSHPQVTHSAVWTLNEQQDIIGLNVHTQTYTHERTHTHTHTNIRTHTLTHTHTNAHPHTLVWGGGDQNVAPTVMTSRQ